MWWWWPPQPPPEVWRALPSLARAGALCWDRPGSPTLLWVQPRLPHPTGLLPPPTLNKRTDGEPRFGAGGSSRATSLVIGWLVGSRPPGPMALANLDWWGTSTVATWPPWSLLPANLTQGGLEGEVAGAAWYWFGPAAFWSAPFCYKSSGSEAGTHYTTCSATGGRHSGTRASQATQLVKNLPAKVGNRVPSLGREDSLEKEMATNSSILAWRIP